MTGPYFFDNSAIVISSRIASSATLALKSGEWFFRFVILDHLFHKLIHLNYWSEILRPPLTTGLPPLRYREPEKLGTPRPDFVCRLNSTGLLDRSHEPQDARSADLADVHLTQALHDDAYPAFQVIERLRSGPVLAPVGEIRRANLAHSIRVDEQHCGYFPGA